MIFMRLFLDAAILWFKKDASDLAAVISYFAIFALAPLFFVSIVLVGYLFGEEVVSSIFLRWGNALGESVVGLLATAVGNLRLLSVDVGVSILGTTFLVWVIIVGFGSVAKGLHLLWSVPEEGAFSNMILRPLRALFFMCVLQVYLALLIGMYGVFLRFSVWPQFGSGVYSVFQLIALALLFAIGFRVLAANSPSFRSLFAGGLVSAILFLFAKYMVNLYLGTTPVTGVYESAGLLIVLLVWIYISAAILFYGAAFAYVHANGKLRKGY